MNKKILKKREERAAIIEQMEGIQALADTENRDLTAEEQTEWDEAESGIETLDKEIKRLEAFAKRQKEGEEQRQKNQRSKDRKPKGEGAELDDINQRFSLVKAIRSKINNEPLTGLELEMHQEATKELREAGLNQESAGISIPGRLLHRSREKRATMTVGTNTTGGYGVDTDLQGITPHLYPKMQVEALGARVITGVQGNISVVQSDTVPAASWVAENGQAPEVNPTYRQVQLSPKRLTAYTPISNQLLLQDSLGVEADLRFKMGNSIAQAVDIASINGSGSSNQPGGILNTSGIGNVAIGTNGGAPTRSHLIKLINTIENANADMGSLGFLTTPAVRAQLMLTALDAGSGRFVWENKEELVGYMARVSTNVPNNLTKGTGTDLDAIIYGNWANWVIYNWSGATIIVDEKTMAREYQTRLIIHSHWDMYAEHTASFAAIKDATTPLAA